jgi:hypothetical protein
MTRTTLCYILLLVVVYVIGYLQGRSYHPPASEADLSYADSLRDIAIEAQERYLIEKGRADSILSIIDSIEKAPKPTISTRLNHAYRISLGSPIADRIKRLDAAPDSIPY